MARAATAPKVKVKSASDHVGDALMALKHVDLRKITDAENRAKVKTARTLLTEARTKV